MLRLRYTRTPIEACHVVVWGKFFWLDRLEFCSAKLPNLDLGVHGAIAALKLGCSPVKAIELAAECNVFTGGEIMTMEIPRVALQEAAE